MVNKKINPKKITGSRLSPNQVKLQELNNGQLTITFPRALASLKGIKKGDVLTFTINDKGKIEVASRHGN